MLVSSREVTCAHVCLSGCDLNLCLSVVAIATCQPGAKSCYDNSTHHLMLYIQHDEEGPVSTTVLNFGV